MWMRWYLDFRGLLERDQAKKRQQDEAIDRLLKEHPELDPDKPLGPEEQQGSTTESR